MVLIRIHDYIYWCLILCRNAYLSDKSDVQYWMERRQHHSLYSTRYKSKQFPGIRLSSEQVLWEDGNPALKIICNMVRHEESEGAAKTYSQSSQVLVQAQAAVFHLLVRFGSLAS